MTNALVTINGARPGLPTVLGQGPVRIPTAGKIRAGIKVLTKKAAEHPKAKEIYERGVADNESFEVIERAISEAVPGTQDAADPEERAVVHGAAGRFCQCGDRQGDPGGVRRRPRRWHEAALSVSGRVSGRHVASGDAARAHRVGGEREEVLERIRAGRPGALLQVLRAGTDGPHGQAGDPRLRRAQDHVAPGERRLVRSRGLRRIPEPPVQPVGALHLLHSRHQVDRRVRASHQQFLRDERGDPEVRNDRLHARRTHLRVPGREADVVLHHQEAHGRPAHRRGGAGGARGALDHRARGAGRRDDAVACQRRRRNRDRRGEPRGASAREHVAGRRGGRG